MLYHYVFRGLGVLLAIGMLTILALATHSQFPAPETRPQTHTGERRAR